VKKFYDRHYSSKEEASTEMSVADSVSQLKARGGRYYCVFDQLEDPAKLNALELGFGYPQISNALASVFAKYKAIDVAAETILANYKGTISFDYAPADLNEDFPIETASVDVVIAMMVIEHLFDPFHSFSEVGRICKPGGWAFVNLPLITSIKNRKDLLLGRMPMTSTRQWFEMREWDGGHLHNFDIAHVRRLAALYGLTLTELYPVGRMFSLKKLAPGLLCGELSFVFRRDR
jgi:SAM-dependent methyltransferase